MADNKTVHELADYKIAQVGPTRDWDFTTDGGKIAMKTYSIQLEGIVDWVDFNQKADTDAPVIGSTIRGHVEDAGKYGFKFVKERKQGGWSGGGKSNPGAAWANAVETATSVVSSYYSLTGKKPKTVEEFLGRVKSVAPSVKSMVDEFAGTSKKEETTKSESETGESPTKDNGVKIDNVDDSELGDW